jgi:hypothetical protein
MPRFISWLVLAVAGAFLVVVSASFSLGGDHVTAAPNETASCSTRQGELPK